ncbi:hypothetical protein ACH4D5_36860 [Streptomyces sp. NPDC018029]|uniref:hypothetical protein n=1 Tax=Streptomyces sp. NPDC018029 TaxID=3365032 RepID=UPI00379D237D
MRKSFAIGIAAVALAGSALAAPTAGASAPSATVTAAPADCPKGYFCGYKKANFKDLAFRFKDCYTQEIPDGLNSGGSWYNNQTPGTSAWLLGKHKELVYATPGAPSKDASGNWAPIWYVDAC